MIGRPGPGYRIPLAAAVLAGLLGLFAAACSGTGKAPFPPPEPPAAPAADNVPAAFESMPPVIPIPDAPEPVAEPREPAAPPPAPATPVAAAPAQDKAAASPSGAAVRNEDPVAGPPPPVSSPERISPPAHAGTPHGKKPKAVPQASGVPAPEPPAPAAVTTGMAAERDVPIWAREREALAYRVNFLGITMGYARFRYAGKVSIGERTAYHLNVRAWTSGILAFIYPINETIDYYLDTETIEPIRVEYTGRKNKKDDVAFYDQEKGRIVYRYRHNGEIRKQVDVVPGIHDPVSATYYFRWRDMEEDGKPRNVYGGRKVYQISARIAGKEKIETALGEIDSLVIQPVIRRDGKLDKKGDLRMWVSSDERRVPVRFYAKFRKIRDWTLVGEILPGREGG